MNNQQQKPTKEQMQFASEQLKEAREILLRTIQLKEQKRKSIVLNAKAEMGLLDIELEALDLQVKQFEEAMKQNNENMKSASGAGMSGLVLKPHALGLVTP